MISKETITYHQILENALHVAKQFRSLGVSKGDVVALMIENTLHIGSYIMGALLTDAIFAPLNPSFTPCKF